MGNFYFFIWLRWSLRVSLCSVVLASIFSLSITAYIYINQGTPLLNQEILEALFKIFKFWFPLALSISLLIALFRSIKYIFNVCIAGYELKLLECSTKESLEAIGYGDLIKVWRKWFMIIIWLVGAQMILVLALMYIISDFQDVFAWFNIYVLYLFILIAGYLSFILLGGRCKKVKVIKC